MNALEKLRSAQKFLKISGIENADRETELIIAHCLGTDRVVLYKDNPYVPENILAKINEFIERRSKREPLQYILGYVEFHGLKIKVGPGVLIPRPETELLVEEAIKIIKSQSEKIPIPSHPPLAKGGSRGAVILDLCTGSGCLALALAKEFPDAEVYGTDTSEIALQFARENASINGIKNVTFLKGSLFEPVKKLFTVDRLPFTADLIISNPPYIKRDDIGNLQPEIKDWEPIEALDGGEDGLDYYRMIILEARNYLKQNNILMFELGVNQSNAVKKIALDEGFQNISLVRDYAGIERIMILR